MNELFELRGTLDKDKSWKVAVLGAGAVLFLWWAVVASHMVKEYILPSPFAVFQAFPYLLSHNVAGRLIWHLASGHVGGWQFQYPVLIEWHSWRALGASIPYPFLVFFGPGTLYSNFLISLKINLLAYAEAIAIALPIGFLMGLIPAVRAMSKWWLDSLRYLPLTAALGLFILWFHISYNMKIQFLTFGTLVYLLPAVVVRIDEVRPVYDQTAITLGATRWQRVLKVFLPDVLSKISLDLLNLTAISWTYIIVVESINRGEGGIGSMFAQAQRMGRVDWNFALLLIIILFGFGWDKFWRYGDRKAFPFKYLAEAS